MTGAVEARVTLERGGFGLDAELALAGPGVTALFGPSGSGKSTLLRCLAGLEPAARGRIVVGGEVWLDSARGRALPPHRRRAALVFQDSNLFPHLSVRANLDFARRRARGEAPALAGLAARIGVEPLLERRPESLSGGERQRVAIARALLAAPRLLLLDEPLASLDVAARAEILALLRRVLAHAPIPVLYVTHARSEALQLADQVVLLDAGRVAGAGPVREMALRPELGGEDALGAVVEGEVTAVDAGHELSTLAFAGGVFAVPGCLVPGERRRLEVLARDVSLALEPPRRSSILNVLPARVVEVRGARTPRPVVVVAAGETRLLARVSRLSLEQLGIREGAAVYAQVKAVAVVA
ncbi:MAG: molybdenum ABC transporter ATP-binding protein [Deltaproteobacteria bacterium]|nr:molybdenum ABC transporter ATP-binding protein [Deltaproteobacteria bacterium]